MTNPNNPSGESVYQPCHVHGPEPGMPADQEAAFAAFCQLDGVNPDAEPGALRERFQDCYVGTWTDENQMINELTRVNVVEAAIAELQNDGINTSRFVEIDYAALDELMRERWDFMYSDGAVYVFEK